MSLKVLFISHSASRTGAPLILLKLLRWVALNTNIEFEILLRETDEIHKAYSEITTTLLFNDPPVPPESSLSRLLRKLGLLQQPSLEERRRELVDYYCSANFDLIYSNTITNGDILEFLEPLECPVVTHVHELKYWIEKSGPKNLIQIKRYTDQYIAGGSAVKDCLVTEYDIPIERISVVDEFISLPEQQPPAETAAAVRRSVGIPLESFVVVGSGLETYRKGKDLFIQLAEKVVALKPKDSVHFMWVGGWDSPTNRLEIEAEIESRKLSGVVYFIGQVNDPLEYFAASDVLALVSREEPFGIVCLEAAVLMKPTLCFSDNHGAQEFVEEDAGFAVPYLDLDAMAEKIVLLSNDPNLVEQLGRRAAEKVRQKYVDEIGAAKITGILRQYSA